jgi:pyruvate ferredoxin oxidoreductase alpha subunit
MIEKNILEGSRAIALTIRNISPDVISAYPITPQTHIVEDLASLKNKKEADYEYIRAESEFAAASIVLGASAAGSRSYSATSSQGLLLMAEVLYNISGMRLPVVITVANRALSAPISIWNDHQDIMALRDSGWIILFAENNQEAVHQHILAYKIAEKTNLPVMVNVDGFILTHCYEPVHIPSKTKIRSFLGKYSPKKKTFLDPQNPVTLGAFMAPPYYQENRESFQKDFNNSSKEIKKAGQDWNQENALTEYRGPKTPESIIIAMGSVVGTIKAALKKNKKTGILKIKTYRPFPEKEIYDIIKKAKKIAVLEKAISPGSFSPLYLDIKSISSDRQNIKSFVAGLGGKDIPEKSINKIIDNFDNYKELNFIC